MMKRSIIFIAFFVATTFAGPCLAKESSKINRPVNVALFSSIGDTMLRVQLRESLPNAFGGADVFGRKRDRGVVILTYGGIRDGRAVVRRRTVDILSNETTMSRGGMSYISGTADTSGVATTTGPITSYNSSTNYSGTVTRAPQATVTALPPDTIEQFLDPVKGGFLTVEDRIIQIEGADENVLRFKVVSSSSR